MKNPLRNIGKCLLILFIIIFVVIIALIINNRIYYVKFSSADIDSNTLAKSEISTTENILNWLDNNGDEIFDGGDGSIDLILFNRSYMAQILLVKRLDVLDWQEKLLYKGYTPESLLREYINK